MRNSRLNLASQNRMQTWALNIYFWGAVEQNRLLTECVGPTVREMWEAQALERFWIDRFDTRSPHVLLLLGGPEERTAEVRARLFTALDQYFSRTPSLRWIERKDLELRHTECRGKHLCSLDLLPGLEPNNSYRWVDDPEDAYVLRRTPQMDEAVVRKLLAHQAMWSIDQLRRGGTTATAVRWAAGLSAALTRARVDPAEFWRFYASTLVLTFRTAIEMENPAIVEALPRLVGERNIAVFDSIWAAALEAEPVWPRMNAFAACIADEAPCPERTHFMREFSHAVLAQLDQFVRVRIPLSLYAWYRTRQHPTSV